MSTQKLLFIIVLYNQDLRLVQSAIDSIKNVNVDNSEVFLVNNRPKADLDYQNKLNLVGLNFHFSNPSKNRGFSGAVNLGLEFARKNNYDLVILLNDDSIILKTGFEKIIKLIRGDNIDILGGVVISQNAIYYRGGYFSRLFGYSRNYSYQKTISKQSFSNRIISTGYVTGCFMVIGRPVFRRQAFDNDLFMYFEDVDFCQKARKSHFKVEFLDTPVIRHLKDSSRLGETEAYFLARNPFAIIKKESNHIYQITQIIGQLVVWLPRNLFRLQSFSSGLSYLKGIVGGIKLLWVQK